MTTVFGKSVRGRRKAEVEEVASLADEANLWWTRRDFVQHAVVRTNKPEDIPHPKPARDDPIVDPALDGHAFSEVFTTESLFVAENGTPRTAPRQPDLETPEPLQEVPIPPSPRPAALRYRIPLNHPLTESLTTLGLDGNATWSDVQQAFRALAKTAHPDHTGDNGEAMASINAAHSALRDSRRYGFFGDD